MNHDKHDTAIHGTDRFPARLTVCDPIQRDDCIYIREYAGSVFKRDTVLG